MSWNRKENEKLTQCDCTEKNEEKWKKKDRSGIKERGKKRGVTLNCRNETHPNWFIYKLN